MTEKEDKKEEIKEKQEEPRTKKMELDKGPTRPHIPHPFQPSFDRCASTGKSNIKKESIIIY